jgi:predicted enzyme related to lactoylglutathione lyase
MISHVKFISIPFDDQDRALAFYRDKLGFKVITDQPFNETQRWIELRIGGAETSVVLFNTDDGMKGGAFSGNFACDNVKKTYEDFLARGVEFLGPPNKTHWGEFAVMKDSEGNRLMLSSR